MTAYIGMNNLLRTAQRNHCKMESLYIKGEPKYTIAFIRDGAEVGRAKVVNFAEGGPECVALSDLTALFPAESIAL